MTRDTTRPARDADADEVIDCARAVEEAIQRLCRATMARPGMTPADVDVVLAHLVAPAGALPQITRQLGDILEQAKDGYVLEMDALTATADLDLAIDTAQVYLAAIREPALDVHRLLNAAHNETAHMAASTSRRRRGTMARTRWTSPRPADRPPPPRGEAGRGSGSEVDCGAQQRTEPDGSCVRPLGAPQLWS